MITTIVNKEEIEEGTTVTAEAIESKNKKGNEVKMEKEITEGKKFVRLGKTVSRTENLPAMEEKSEITAGQLPAEVKNVKAEAMSKEENELNEREQVIRTCLGNLLGIGKMLDEIFKMNLYKVKGYKTIADYSEKEWGLTYRRFKQLTDAHSICENVNKISSSPVKMTNEGQARQLGRIPEHKHAEVWDEVVKGLPEGEMPTAKVIQAVVDKKLGKTPKMKVETKEKAPKAVKGTTELGMDPVKYMSIVKEDAMEIISWAPASKEARLREIAENNNTEVQSVIAEQLRVSAGGGK